MDTGTKISGVAHGLVMILAFVGGPLFDSEPDDSLQVSEVALISSAEFEALKSGAPEPEAAPEPAQIEEPSTEENPVSETPVAEPEPSTPEEVVQPAPPEPELAPEEPVEPEQPNIAVGQTEQETTGVVADVEQQGENRPDQAPTPRAKPRPAERISNIVRDTETQAETQTQEQTVATPSEASDEKPEEKPQEDQPKTTTEIVTEADETEKTFAPVKSKIPRGRPLDLETQVAETEKPTEPKPEENLNSESAEDLIAAQIAEDLENESKRKAAEAAAKADAARSAAANSGQNGTALSNSEREGLIFAVQQCWNVPVAIKDASELKVTLRVSLTEDGFLTGSPELISPKNSPLTGVQHAYEAGRRALIRCQPFELPADKYETWKEIEIVFNPQKMVLK